MNSECRLFSGVSSVVRFRLNGLMLMLSMLIFLLVNVCGFVLLSVWILKGFIVFFWYW